MARPEGSSEPSPADVRQMPGLVLLEFGASWCGHCLAIQAPLAALLRQNPAVQHTAIEDGPGQPLGRSFQVKLWPTFVLLRDGQLVTRLVRPTAADIGTALAAALA